MGNTMLQMRRLANVKRWQIVRTLTDMSVLEHSVHVLYIYQWLAPSFDINMTPGLIRSILEHDIDEATTGDRPSNSKPSTDPSDVITKEEALLKAVDRLEVMVHLQEEIALGNTTVEAIYRESFDSYVMWYQRAQELYPACVKGAIYVAEDVMQQLNPTIQLGLKA